MIGIAHFVRNAKPGTLFTVRGRGYRVASPVIAFHPGLAVFACERMRAGKPVRGIVDVGLRFGRDTLSVYAW